MLKKMGLIYFLLTSSVYSEAAPNHEVWNSNTQGKSSGRYQSGSGSGTMTESYEGGIEGYSTIPENRPYVQSHISDQRLTEVIQDVLSPKPNSWGFTHVTFTVNDGHVTLQGYVNSQAEKETLENEIRSINGVQAIDSKVTTLQ
jgi:hypothetical protein